MLSRSCLKELVEGVAALDLQPGGQRIDVEAGLGDGGDRLFGVTPVSRQHAVELAVVTEGEQCRFRHGVDRVVGGERGHIEGVGYPRILGAGAGKQHPLRRSAGGGELLPAIGLEQVAIGLEAALADGDAELVVQFLRQRLRRRDVPA